MYAGAAGTFPYPGYTSAHYALGAWSAAETVSSGDSLVMSNGDNDQSPSIATDLSSLPYVSYLDGTGAVHVMVIGGDDVNAPGKKRPEVWVY